MMLWELLGKFTINQHFPHPWHSPIFSALAELVHRGFAGAVPILSLPQSQARDLFSGIWRAQFLLGLSGFKRRAGVSFGCSHSPQQEPAGEGCGQQE